MVWFRKPKTPKKKPPRGSRRVQVREGLWTKCDACKEIIFHKDVEQAGDVCPRCDRHFRIGSRDRLARLMDDGRYETFDDDVAPTDPLDFVDTKPYRQRLEAYQQSTGLKDAFVSATGTIGGHRVIIGLMEYGFMGGSMGSVVGEKVTRCAERALAEGLPLLIVSCSGGARMQEGVLSLMQMAKISAALARLGEAGLPYISILTDPTTGGVTASFAMLGDLNLAEPGALIGFAGPRVIEQTIRQKLPPGFQRAEFLLEHGMIDRVVPRAQMRDVLIPALAFMARAPKASAAVRSGGGA